jgi:hypothetical protein
VRKALVATVVLLVLALSGSLPSSASARPCSDRVPVIVAGVQWIVYTGDSARERRAIPCAKARRIAKRKLRGRGTPGWNCSASRQRCVRGGTYVDDSGNRLWRYLVGWHRAD